MTTQEIKLLSEMLLASGMFINKEMLTSKETAAYLGISQQYLWTLTSHGKIPFYKPMGKNLYFNRTELNQWLMSDRYRRY